MILGMVTRTPPCSFFFWGGGASRGMGEGGLLAGMKRLVPSTCLARAPPFPIVSSHYGDSDATM